jgi:hypothetical protein
MTQARLCLHRGARFVERDELEAVPAPEPTKSWYPLKHGIVLDTVERALNACGYQIKARRLGLSRNDRQFFGVLDLQSRLADGVTLAVGVRNSTDKTFPLGFCAGNRVFVCDNLAFASELLVRRKHTRFGQQRFAAAIGEAVARLKDFEAAEEGRIERFMGHSLSDTAAESLILRSFEQGLLPTPFVLRALSEWRVPSHEAFRSRTLWSLENAMTAALRPVGEVNPARYASLTLRLQPLLETAAFDSPLPFVSRPAVPEVPALAA